jgi:S-DNA-T family DNA segregation ATPase FtsK/SpoIIIE
MSTWGPSKRRSGKRATKVSGRAAGSPSGGVRDATPPDVPRSRRDRAEAELREAVDGREHEFIGLGLIGVGALLALAIYLDLAGPLGRGVETLTGWFTGLGRYIVPVVLIASGIAFVRRGRSYSPFRLAAGWLLVCLAALGLLHLISGPDKISAGVDDLGDSGGWLGALAAEPLRALLATAGAAVVLVAAFLGGVLIITQTSLRTMAAQTGGFLSTVVRPVGRAARSGIDNLSSLSSDRHHTDAEHAGGVDGFAGPGPVVEVSGTGVYDFAAEESEEWVDASAPASRKPSPKPKAPVRNLPGAPAGDGARVGSWVLPRMSLLEQPGSKKIDRKAIEARGQTLQESLTSHNVDTTLVGMTVGPTVTRYELELGAGVKVAKVTSLQKDIAYAMAATDVRILAPIPGRSAIGVEVPNQQRQLVALGDLLASPEAARASRSLDVAVGKDIAGEAVFLDLAATPHLLIAGATGAGKSSALNCIITSLLMRTTPDEVRLILIDPKQVEMGQYQRLPHLLTQPVTNPKKAANALGWAVKEMDRRYDLLSELGVRDIAGYNDAVAKGTAEPPPGSDIEYEHMPFIVVVVDELNDLMMVAARDVEESITRIAQKARAVGIHLIVATQRPSVNVITGVIKANIPARMAFAVSSLTDSRVILDQPGAEKLVGKGDMLLLPGNSSIAGRIQGSFVSEDEVRQVVAHWRAQAPEPVYSTDVDAESSDGAAGASGVALTAPALVPPTPGAAAAITGALDVTSDANAFSAGAEDDDTVMMKQAMELVVRSQLGSTSMLQRKLKVGFARAGRMMDLLEQRGVVGPSEGSKARSVLMTVEEFELLQQNGQL